MQLHTLPKQNSSWLIDTVFLLLILGGLFFILLGVRPLFVPDEGRYAEIAREMAVSGDFVTPYLNSIKYFEKPALFYWLGALAIKIGGLNLWSIRSLNALLALFGCLLTYGVARNFYNRTTGLLAALILGTSTLYFVMAHMVSLDLPVTVFLSASLFGFILGIKSPSTGEQRFYFWGAAIMAGLAVLTKGLIGIVLPGIIITSWIALMGDWRLIKRLPLFSSILIFLAVTLPWHILVGLKNPEFFYFYFVEQHFLRYTLKEIGHYQPVWFFIPNLILAFFPWIVFLPQAIWANLPKSFRSRQNFQIELFLLLWATIIFAFFSFSKSKLIPYILPVLPPLAVLTARYLTHGIKNNSSGIKIGFVVLSLFSVIIAGVFYWFTHETNLPNANAAKLYFGLAAGFLVAGSILSLFYQQTKALVITITSTWLFLLFILAGMPAIDARSIMPIANTLKPLLKPQDEVITFNQYYQDLPFYLERRVSILNWRNELTFGMQHQNTKEWMIDDETFWQRFRSKQRVFLVMSKSEYAQLQNKNSHEKFYELAKTINNVLISNQKF